MFLLHALLCVVCISPIALWAQTYDGLPPYHQLTPDEVKAQEAQLLKLWQASEVQRQKDLAVFSNDVVRNAPIVFEGRIRQAEQYFNADSTHIYHAALIEITSVVRGQEYIKVGTIELRSSLPDGFETKSFISHIINYELPLPPNYNVFSNQLYDTASVGRAHLFFCKEVKAISPYFGELTNQLVVEDYQAIFRDYGQEHCSIYYPMSSRNEEGYGGFGNLIFEKTDEGLCNYLSKYGLQLDKCAPVEMPQKATIKRVKSKKRKRIGYKMPSVS